MLHSLEGLLLSSRVGVGRAGGRLVNHVRGRPNMPKSNIINGAGFSAIGRTLATGEVVKERPVELPRVEFIDRRLRVDGDLAGGRPGRVEAAGLLTAATNNHD